MDVSSQELEVRRKALDAAMQLHGEYSNDANFVVEAAKQFEAYLKGEVSLAATTERP